MHGLDSIRILELVRVHQKDTAIKGRLITTTLDKRSRYVALSYVWGKKSCDDPILHIAGHPMQIRPSLWQALEELTTHVSTIRVWVDQICINQDDKTERERQVQPMSRIYAQAQRVVGWLWCHDKDSHLAFDHLLVLGHNHMPHDGQPDPKWQRATDALMKDGHLCKLQDLVGPTRRAVQAVASLVLRPWFHRLWIVQEVALASTLELRCGNSSISSDTFHNVIRLLCSTMSNPPMPWLQKPYRNAQKLGQLRAQVRAGEKHSFPHLAHTLSGWRCGKDHDRLFALFGLIFRNSKAWFTPSYSTPASEFYLDFARANMRLEGS